MHRNTGISTGITHANLRVNNTNYFLNWQEIKIAFTKIKFVAAAVVE